MISFRNPTPEDHIRQLREGGLPLAEVARQAGSTVAVVRRIVGRVDKDAARRQQEATARRINAEPVAWSEKVAMWKDQTGQCAVTFWRVLRRCERPAERRD